MREKEEIVAKINELTRLMGEIEDKNYNELVVGKRNIGVYRLYERARRLRRYYGQIRMLTWVLGESETFE